MRKRVLMITALLTLCLGMDAVAQTVYGSRFVLGTRTNVVCVYDEGTGSPEGVRVGNVCDVYLQTNGTPGATLWVKETGTGNTGWTAVGAGGGGGAPTNATYITQTANGTLTNEQALGALASALLVNTTTTGVLSAYAGSSCTNQFVRGLSALGVSTCASVSLTADVTGTLPVGNGGIGITSGTSGGVPYFSGSTTIASSAALTQNRIVLGGGAGAAPTVVGSLGSTVQVLHGNASGAPTFGAVVLTSDVSGILAVANGGTGISSGTGGGVPYYSGASIIASSGVLGDRQIVVGGGAGNAPTSTAGWTITTGGFSNSTTQPAAIAYNNTTQSINNGTFTALALNTEQKDQGGLHDNATNNTRMTVPANAGGFYLIEGTCGFLDHATGVRACALRLNGTTYLRAMQIYPPQGVAEITAFSVSFYGDLVAGDYIEVYGYQTSGAALNTGSASARYYQNQLIMIKLF